MILESEYVGVLNEVFALVIVLSAYTFTHRSQWHGSKSKGGAIGT
jgi:hypothetical protein